MSIPSILLMSCDIPLLWKSGFGTSFRASCALVWRVSSSAMINRFVPERGASCAWTFAGWPAGSGLDSKFVAHPLSAISVRKANEFAHQISGLRFVFMFVPVFSVRGLSLRPRG